MNREHVPGVEFFEHAPCLLGGCVHVIPGVVGSDAEDCESDWWEALIGFGLGGVAGEEDSLRVRLRCCFNKV